MREVFEVKELKECEDIAAANKLLETGNWVLLKVFVEKQLCFQKVTVPSDSMPNKTFSKVQPFDKIVRLYVVGKIN